MASSNIHIVQFDAKTWPAWQVSPFKAVYSHNKMHNMKAGDIVVAALKSKHESGIVFVATVKGECVEQDLLDVDTFTGENAHYNKYHFVIDRLWLLPALMPFADVAIICGKTLNDRTQTNLFKPTLNRRKAYYSGEDKSMVMDRYHVLIESLMNVPVHPAPLAVAEEVPCSSSSSTPVVAAAAVSLPFVPAVSVKGQKARKARVRKELHDYLCPNEVVYNTVCPKGGKKETWVATYVSVVDTLVMNDGRSFLTSREFSLAHREAKGLTGNRNGFNACHVIRNGKQVMLCDLLPLPIN
jgi:hypothetical protein